jgi:NADH:ubiquinone oxidoreductase subunit F (NADH-binding)
MHLIEGMAIGAYTMGISAGYNYIQWRNLGSVSQVSKKPWKKLVAAGYLGDKIFGSHFLSNCMLLQVGVHTFVVKRLRCLNL